MKNLTIDPERLWDDLMQTAKIGATPKGGICRLTLTELDREVRDWFKAQTRVARLRGHHRRHGHDVRAARRPATRHCRPSPWAAISTPSRPAANSTARSACSRRWKRCARCTAPATKPSRRSRSSTGPTRKARASRPPMIASGVFAGVYQPRLGLRARRPRRRDLRRRARQDRLSRRASLRRRTALGLFRAAHRARSLSSRPRARTSASSPACRRCAGTK